ncbi:asparagine synthase (glutamine-hydrolyzing) [Streptomyces sp. NRRL WC-3742]|uniref:asparagine synthase (glutamine-hydrolyzing) n=1 Tax=Streptomyces sp. NRRL WC-3742 TaxID=1463934 RepID=UPI0004C61A35|nr:asparagine synthase (glutamine-hydrolyzing) [Streptomyces sp. NRRL WC-3742]
MCGIAGSMAFGSARPTPPEVLERMTAVLAHRGPDAAGHLLQDGVALGFRRLSLVDLEGGAQPMTGEDGTVTMVCNGEIFNHRELRALLEARGHRFRTDCDVEVVLHLYEDEGPALLERLNGQFAFAVHDRRRGRLFLARDHAGIAPLYYTATGGHFVFGSEIKALLEHPGVPREVDPTGLDQVLTFPGLVSPRTMFRGIRSLKNGHQLIVSDGRVEETAYWDLDYPTADQEQAEGPPRTDESYGEQLRELLDRAVRSRLRADAPVGFYLSGGLDSALIGALTAQAGPPVHSFSIAFPGADIDESRYQRLMASRIGSLHHEAEFTGDDIADRLHRMVLHSECPVRETYNTCSLVLSSLARSHGVKAVLSGEGSDELFGGYLGYRFDAGGRTASDTGDPLEDALEEDVRARLWGDPSLFYERRYHAWREAKSGLYSDALRKSLDEFDCLAHPVVDHRRLAGRPRLSQRSYLDFTLRLSDHLLTDHGDRMALANSVEARYPFLDRDVLEFARTTPNRLKVNALGEKAVVKQAARGLVPPEIVHREKYGFRAPGSPGLLQLDLDWVNDLLSPARIARQGYFDPAVVERLRAEHLREGADLHPHLDDDVLLVVLTFGILLDVFRLPGHL